MEFTINDPLDLVEAEIDRAAPDLVAFSCYIWNIAPILEICDSLKKARPELRILLGGPEVTYDAPALLAMNPAVDFIISGEGEQPWTALLAALPDGPWSGVPALTWREGGTIGSNPAAPPLSLDTLPDPYGESPQGLAGRLVYCETSRGCPFSCAFCLSGNPGAVRFLDPERALAGIDALAGSGALAVKFVDRTFNCRRGHAMAVWQGLLRHRGGLRFHFELAGDLLTEEDLAFLAAVPPGLFQFEIGVQSTNPETLAAIGRPQDLGRLAANVRRLAAAGNIHLHLDFIAGLPYEDYERFLASLDFGLDLRPDTLQLGFLKMLKGSSLRREAETLGYVYRRRPPYEIIRNPWLSFSDIRRLKTMAVLIGSFFNERRFAASLPRLWRAWPSPARFFADLAAWWEGESLHLRPHQAKDLPGHLLRFAASRGQDGPVLRDCLRYDLHCLGRYDGEPPWAAGAPPEPGDWRLWLRDPGHRALLGPEFTAAGPREALRRVKVLSFRHDPAAPPEEISPGPATIALIYPERGGGERVRAVRLPPDLT